MSTPPDHIVNIAKDLEQFDMNVLLRTGKDINFSGVESAIRGFFVAVRTLASSGDAWEDMPVPFQQRTATSLQMMYGLIDQVRSFKIDDPDLIARRDQLIKQINSTWVEISKELAVPLAFAHSRALLGFEARLEAKFGEVLTTAKSDIDQISRLRTQADEIFRSIQEAAGKTGAVSYAKVFEQEANEHGNLARRWLVGTVIVAFVLLGFLTWTFTGLVDALKVTAARGESGILLQLFLAKILLLSFASVVFYQVVKNYNSNRHLQILNRHRANGLRTFDLFVEAGKEPAVRDAILLQATKAIFESGDTGFVSGRDGSMPGVDIIKLGERIGTGKP